MHTLPAKLTVEKDLRSIRAEDLADLNDKIKSLIEQPRQHKTEQLKGVGGYRLRFENYLILYAIDEGSEIVTIHREQHRIEVYR